MAISGIKGGVTRVLKSASSDGDRTWRVVWRTTRPWVLTGFVILHLATGLVLSLPVGRFGNRAQWEKPAVQREFAELSRELNGHFGLEWTAAELEEELWQLAQGYLKVRRRVTAPFRAYAELAGMSQRWRLFATPLRTATQVRVTLLGEGDARVLYETGPGLCRWRCGFWSHFRTRKWLVRLPRRLDSERYQAWAERLAAWAAADHPRATGLRIEVFRLAIPAPGAGVAGKLELLDRRDLDLDDHGDERP